MYEKFYHLKEKPFNVTPDPRFLYLGEHHQEALANLIYGIRERKGFVVITGEVGTGKTTLIRALLERLEPSVKTALIFNPNLTLGDFFLLLFDELELKVPKPTKANFLIALNTFLLERLQRNENTVLIIDEAQNLPASILEEIRLLLNMETAKEKLLQIVLSGQPELNKKLNLPEIRQLKQRISIRYDIPPLNRKEAEAYIKRRLKVAGCRNPHLFSAAAIDEIYAYAKGIPRLINILGDNALLSGYAEDRQKIDHRIVRECIADLALKKTKGKDLPAAPPKAPRSLLRISAMRLALLLLFLVVIFGGLLWWNKESLSSLPAYFLSIGTQRPTGHSDLRIPDRSQRTFTKPAEKKTSFAPEASATSEASFPATAVEDENVMKTQPSAERDNRAELLAEVASKRPDLETAIVHKAPPFLEPERIQASDAEPAFLGETVTVKANEWLTGISLKRYGKVNEEILAMIQRANPQIEDLDHIEAGWNIVLPPLHQTETASELYSVHIASFRKFHDAHALFSQLVSEGNEAYLIPVTVPGKGRWYRITLRNFRNEQEAREYARQLARDSRFHYAQPVPISQKTATEIEQ